DTFVTKLDATTGAFTWADHFSGASGNSAHGLALDGAGNVYTAGSFSGSTDFDPRAGALVLRGTRPFLTKPHANGNLLAAWPAANALGNGMAADSAGDVWLSGEFTDTTTLPTGQTFQKPAGAYENFVMRMNTPNAAVLGSLYADLNNNGVR